MNPILIIGLIATVLWGVILLRRFGLLAACAFTLLMGTCFGYDFFHVSLLTSDRLLVAVLLAAYVVHRKLGIHEPKPISKADILGVGLVLVIAFSAVTHDWRWNGMVPASRFVFYWLLPLTMYWVARQSHLSPLGVRRLFWGVGIFGVYVSVTSFFESRGLYQFVIPRYIASPAHSEFMGRGRGPLLNPSGNGVLLTYSMGCALMLYPYFKQFGRLVLGCALLLFLVGHYATLTRCVWLGGVMCLSLVAYATFPYHLKKLFFVGGLFAALIVLPLNWERLQAFKRDKDVSVSDMRDSAKLRPILAYVSWKMFLEQPMFGVGFGLYKKYDVYYLHDRSTNLPLEKVRDYHQHNVFLSLLTETGLVGLSLYVGLLGCWCVYALRLWRQRAVPLEYRQLGLAFLCLFTAYFANGMFQDLTIMPMVHTIVAFVAGITVSQYQVFFAPMYREPRVSLNRRWIGEGQWVSG